MQNLAQRMSHVRLYLGTESLVILALLILLAFLFYKLFLRDASAERHTNIKAYLAEIYKNYIVVVVLVLTLFTIESQLPTDSPFQAPLPYLTIIAALWGGWVLVRTCRLVLLMYLFLGSMKAGVPVLLVNIFSLVMSITLLLWGISSFLKVQLAPLLATSAVFSIVLGLALQDTLGNLFAGISLQLDRAFDIDDWIEIASSNQKFVGQVREISWRSTTLLGWSDEVITIPNRILASSQISNFQNGEANFVRSQIFRLSYTVDPKKVQPILLGSLKAVPEIKSTPPPVCFVSETSDSWMTFKLVYSISNYGSQFIIGDKVLCAGWTALMQNGISPQQQKIQIHQELENQT